MDKSKPSVRVSAKKVPKGKKRLHRVEIEKADNGGYSVTHHFRGGEGESPSDMGYHMPETHVYSDFNSMHGDLPLAFSETQGGPPSPAANTQEGNEEMPTAKGA